MKYRFFILLIIIIGIYYINQNDDDKTDDIPIIEKKVIEYFPTPENGFSPYDEVFGKGIYNKSDGNNFIIKNSNSSHAVVLLVNVIGSRKVRNEFVRKGETFSMTSVPNGTYFLRWFSGNDWSPNIELGELTGGFQSDVSFSQSDDVSDWMEVTGGDQWTITLYAVNDGNMISEDIDLNDFIK